eukprot:g78252.t1
MGQVLQPLSASPIPRNAFSAEAEPRKPLSASPVHQPLSESPIQGTPSAQKPRSISRRMVHPISWRRKEITASKKSKLSEEQEVLENTHPEHRTDLPSWFQKLSSEMQDKVRTVVEVVEGWPDRKELLSTNTFQLADSASQEDLDSSTAYQGFPTMRSASPLSSRTLVMISG